MSKKNLSLLMDGFMGEANQAESVQEQPKEQATEQAEQPTAQTDKQESPKAVSSKTSTKKTLMKQKLPENEIQTGSQTQGKCGSPQERRNSQKCQEAPGNSSHLHRRSGFTSKGEVHFSCGRCLIEGRYL